MSIRNCPMGSEWRNWDLSTEGRFRPSNPEERASTEKAQKTKRGKRLKQIEVSWETAPDDVQYQPVPQDSHFAKGSPCHLHTEFKVDDVLIHIDRLYANKYAPGRSYVEFRIFVNGTLAGRGGSAGSSLGGSGNSDLPAVALIGSDKIISVDNQMVVALWEALAKVR